MKFFIVLALVALASANTNYRSSYGGSVLNSGSSYGSGLSGSYGSGLSRHGHSSFGSSGFSLGGGYGQGLSLSGGFTPKLALIQAVPVSFGAQQASFAAPAASYGASYGGSYGGSFQQAASSQQVSGPITAAVHSTRSVQVVDVASTGSAAAPQQIVIGPSVQPIDIEFQSQSSPVSVRQSHIPGQANAPQSSSHTEEADILRQEIVKPVIHEVTEAIQPYRRITQEVRPVQETIQQLITRGQQQQVQSVGYGQSAGYGQSLALQSQPVAASAQYVSQPAAAVETGSQPATLALLLGNVNLGSSSQLSGASLGSLGLSGLGSSSYGGSSGLSLGTGSLSGSSFSSRPSSSYTSVGVDNYRRRA